MFQHGRNHPRDLEGLGVIIEGFNQKRHAALLNLKTNTFKYTSLTTKPRLG